MILDITRRYRSTLTINQICIFVDLTLKYRADGLSIAAGSYLREYFGLN